MGVVDFASITTTFASNYDTAGATVVLPATTVNLPAMPAKPTTPPAAFTASIPFATPYIYTAQKALVWEWVMTSSSTTASYVMDAHSGAATLTGAQTALGTGCTATGQTSPMTADASLTTTATNISYTASTTFGRANSAGATLIGTNNPNAAFPICNGTLYTNALVTVPALSDANGAFTTGALAFSYSPALNGMKVYTQTYTADAAQGPIPAAVSNGVESIIPALPQQYARIYASGNATATTGSLGLAYSVVTRFD